VQLYAEAIVELMDDEAKRSRMGRLGRARVEQELAWSYQQNAYLGVYQDLVSSAKVLDRKGA